MRVSVSIIAALLLIACGGEATNSDSQDVPFTTVARPGNSGVRSDQGVVAHNQSEFDILWKRSYENSGSPPQAPAVDFSSTQILGYFVSNRPSGCYGVSITRVTRIGDRIVVTYKEQIPNPDDMCAAVVISAGHLVAMLQSPLQVEFKAE
jgi:hypothetical protein